MRRLSFKERFLPWPGLCAWKVGQGAALSQILCLVELESVGFCSLETEAGAWDGGGQAGFR